MYISPTSPFLTSLLSSSQIIISVKVVLVALVVLAALIFQIYLRTSLVILEVEADEVLEEVLIIEALT